MNKIPKKSKSEGRSLPTPQTEVMKNYEKHIELWLFVKIK